MHFAYCVSNMGKGIHANMERYLREMHAAQWRRFQRMVDARETADYDLDIRVNKNDAEDQFKRAEDVLRGIGAPASWFTT